MLIIKRKSNHTLQHYEILKMALWDIYRKFDLIYNEKLSLICKALSVEICICCHDFGLHSVLHLLSLYSSFLDVCTCTLKIIIIIWPLWTLMLCRNCTLIALLANLSFFSCLPSKYDQPQ